MLLMKPILARQDDLLWLIGDSDEEVLLRQTIEICLIHPHSKPVVIMRELENKADVKLLRELERELNVWDDKLDPEIAIEGTRELLQRV